MSPWSSSGCAARQVRRARLRRVSGWSNRSASGCQMPGCTRTLEIMTDEQDAPRPDESDESDESDDLRRRTSIRCRTVDGVAYVLPPGSRQRRDRRPNPSRGRRDGVPHEVGGTGDAARCEDRPARGDRAGRARSVLPRDPRRGEGGRERSAAHAARRRRTAVGRHRASGPRPPGPRGRRRDPRRLDAPRLIDTRHRQAAPHRRRQPGHDRCGECAHGQRRRHPASRRPPGRARPPRAHVPRRPLSLMGRRHEVAGVPGGDASSMGCAHAASVRTPPRRPEAWLQRTPSPIRRPAVSSPSTTSSPWASCAASQSSECACPTTSASSASTTPSRAGANRRSPPSHHRCGTSAARLCAWCCSSSGRATRSGAHRRRAASDSAAGATGGALLDRAARSEASRAPPCPEREHAA